MWRFNLTTLSWTNLLDIPKSSSLWNHKMAALRGHLIIQGGLTLVNGTPSANKELWDLDLDKMSWRNVRKTIVNSTSNKPEEFLGGGTLTNWNESLIVVFGGPTETTAVNASRWTISFLGFNATRGNWFWKLENSSSVIPRSGHGSVWDPQSNSLISFGGVPTQRDGGMPALFG